MTRRILLLLLLCTAAAGAQEHAVTAADVKAEFLHAWNGYSRYAWGHDALKPVSKTPRDWYGQSLLLTPVDAYDAMRIMGLDTEAAAVKLLILDSLSFDRDIEVQSFEITIRLLGGLISAYEMDGDAKFLTLAADLGKRLLPVFNTPTGMPWRFVNLRTGKLRDSLNNPAEIGTALIEFGMLSRLTHDEVYYQKAKRALVELHRRSMPLGLPGSTINVLTGDWVDTVSHIGGGIDSYYEYLVKAWILFGDKECLAMWKDHEKAINAYLADSAGGSLWYGQAGMRSGKRVGTEFGSLEAFYPAVLVLAGDTARAERLEASCYKMWQKYDIEPEELDYTTMKPTYPGYYLRPEIIESAWYLREATHDPAYTAMGQTFYRSLVKYCRTDAGYTALTDVTTKKQGDSMESFFFAETLKYLYLLLSPEGTFPIDRVIFNTEAHPVKRADHARN